MSAATDAPHTEEVRNPLADPLVWVIGELNRTQRLLADTEASRAAYAEVYHLALHALHEAQQVIETLKRTNDRLAADARQARKVAA